MLLLALHAPFDCAPSVDETEANPPNENDCNLRVIAGRQPVLGVTYDCTLQYSLFCS